MQAQPCVHGLDLVPHPNPRAQGALWPLRDSWGTLWVPAQLCPCSHEPVAGQDPPKLLGCVPVCPHPGSPPALPRL